MNIILKSVMLMLTVVFFISSCSRQKNDEARNNEITFPSPEEAVAKAKSDLIQALELKKDLNLRIDLPKFKAAQQAKLIRHADVDFEKMLTEDSVASLTDIVAVDKRMIAPFVLNNEIVSIVEIGQASNGWKITGLANKAITNDLNQIGIAQRDDVVVTLYEVPNLQLMVYGVRRDIGESYHLNFEQFTLKDSVVISVFYPLMRERALRFNERFGDELKKGKLVR